MEDKSWIKLYRKAKDNDIMRDQTAWLLFSWILLSVDRADGKWKTGRFLLSDLTGINANTIYKALLRLEEKHKVVTLSSNNKFTEISVLNWAKYQSLADLVTPSVTTKQQQSNNKVTLNNNIRSKNIIINDETFKKAQQRIQEGVTYGHLLDELDMRYPTWKYSPEWVEARKVLFKK